MRVVRSRVSKADLFASLVVFLVALPLCVGVAIASGVPAELGLVTGIVGGLVVGALPGSSLQVSGPAAGLTVLVYEAVRAYGVEVLGVLVFAAGVVQLGLGVLRLGRWFRAVSSAVVQGMLAGIGLVLVAGQVYALGDVAAPAGGVGKLAGLVALPGVVDPVALSVGGATIAVLLLWPRWGRGARLVPAPLVAVALAAAVTGVFDLSVRRVEVRGLVGAVRVPEWGDFGRLTEVGVLGTVVAFALIASAESLFSAAAVDRLHWGPRTDYDRELVAQGAGNVVCGVLGALPMTAVIVRSAVNVRAGARTKASRVLHGGWLLVFTALLPGVLGLVPVAALAGLLVYAGCGLVPVRQVRGLWRGHRGEVVVLGVTAVVIVVGNLFEGVLVGLALAVAKTAWDISHVHVETEDLGDAGIVVRVLGHATFLRLPKLLEALEGVPGDRVVRLELGGLRHVDHACAAALEGWVAGRERERERGWGPGLGLGEGVTAVRGA
ncbi:SulP family inorganic anion transporter [Streptomyces prunicolor]|uniref:SulP family inorganic anion transporter n=1 Tax=Streptomyces prunicolor TaxID=67348 RepID=UPI0022530005|nr:SulP family inorganic anion transporter [Streptomyces prunicolor]MCX5236416.1 SulP family inorganic anion transporter [Streptomyces prunicolor]